MKKTISGDKGFALISVLIILMVLTPLVVNLGYSAKVHVSGADYFGSKAKAIEIARAGFEAAAAALKDDENDYDSILEDWGRFEELSQLSSGFFEEGQFTGNITDEEGKLNLNRLDSVNKVETKEILERLLGTLEYDDGLVDAIVDWIDEDSDSELSGAEDDYYGQLENPYGSKDGPMSTILELSLLKGFRSEEPDSPDMTSALYKYLSLCGDGKVNINTVSPELMLSLSPEMDENSVEEIMARREESAIGSLDELSGLINEDALNSIKSKIKVKSSCFSIHIKGLVREVPAELHAIVKRADGKLKILYYREV